MLNYCQRSAAWRSSIKLKKNVIRNAEVQSIFQERQTSYYAKRLLGEVILATYCSLNGDTVFLFFLFSLRYLLYLTFFGKHWFLNSVFRFQCSNNHL